MVRPSFRARWRPGLRAVVLSVSGVLIVAAAILVSNNVSDHLQTTAVGRGGPDDRGGRPRLYRSAGHERGPGRPDERRRRRPRRRPRAAGLDRQDPADQGLGARTARSSFSDLPALARPSVRGRGRPDRRLRRRGLHRVLGRHRRGERLRARPRRPSSCRSTCRSTRPTGARSSAPTRSTRTRRRSSRTSRRPARTSCSSSAPWRSGSWPCSTRPSRSHRAG